MKPKKKTKRANFLQLSTYCEIHLTFFFSGSNEICIQDANKFLGFPCKYYLPIHLKDLPKSLNTNREAQTKKKHTQNFTVTISLHENNVMADKEQSTLQG